MMASRHQAKGWLHARKAGRYQIATDLTVRFQPGYAPLTCILEAWLESRSFD